MIIKNNFQKSPSSWMCGLNSLSMWWWGLSFHLLTNGVFYWHESVCFSSLLLLWLRVLWISNNYRFSLLNIELMTYVFYFFQSLFLFEMRANQLSDHLSPPYWSAVINLLDSRVSWIHFHLDINKCKYVKVTSPLENSVIKWHISNPTDNWIQSKEGDFALIFWAINIPMDF